MEDWAEKGVIKMKKIAAISGLVVLLSITAVNADIAELDLFDLGCQSVYDIDSQYWTTDFDLGITFIEISNVYIDWAGEITAGLAIEYVNPDETFPLEVGIYAYLSGYPFTRSITVWGGETTYPDPEVFDCRSEIESTNWSDLLDGQGTITIGGKEIIMLNGMYVEHGSATLDRATLIVEGVIPEPTTFFLLIVGVLCLRVKYSIHRCKP